MFCTVLSSEEAPALCSQEVREDPPVVSLFIHVIHINYSTPDSAMSGLKGICGRKELRIVYLFHIVCLIYFLFSGSFNFRSFASICGQVEMD